jgi:NifU-like protein involved in Fe-S cluster formation
VGGIKMDAYSKKVMELFKNPKHGYEMKDADAVGIEGNPVCGDVMKVYIKVGKNKEGKEIIKEVSYQTFGCVAAISSSEALCRIAKGKTLEDAAKITSKDIADYLGSLPPVKFHCSVLGMQTLQKAIKNYLDKKSTK